MTVGFPGAPIGTDARGLVAIVNRINSGKLNCAGTILLTPDQPSTTILDSRATVSSYIGLTPLSASAAVECSGGALYVADRSTGSFTLAHADAPATDRQFAYIVIG